MSFQLWRKLDQKDWQIRLLQGVIVGLLILAGSLWWGWKSAPQDLRVYIPPDLSSGVTLKTNMVPKPFVYSFAFQVWQEINHWPTAKPGDDHEFAYYHNIKTYWPYLTPSFRDELMQEYQDLKTHGRVERTRWVMGTTGAAFDGSQVKMLSPTSWQVTLKVRLTEYAGTMKVKDIEVSFPLEVVRYDISRQDNPYGLALAGFVTPPKRLKTYT